MNKVTEFVRVERGASKKRDGISKIRDKNGVFYHSAKAN